jgi:RNA polymerase sigma-70 factor (ECF subfamily)
MVQPFFSCAWNHSIEPGWGTDSSPGETDWPQIAALYGELARVHPSPVVQLNGAVAIGMSEGPDAG